MATRKGGIRSSKLGMKGHKCKKSNLAYNLTSQYTLAAFICVFIFPYLTNHLVLTSFPYAWASLCNPKCLFVVVNVIVIFLVGESRAGAGTGTAAGPVNEIFEEYVKRGRRLRRSAGMKKRPYQEEEEEKRAEAGERPVIKGGGEEEEEEILEKKNTVHDNKEEQSNGEEKQKVEEEGKEKVIDENELEDEEKEEEEGVKKVVEAKEEGEETIEVDEKSEEKKGKVLLKKEEEEEREVMPREELNMRVEAFIARVNKQRQMESRLLVSIRPAA